MTIFLKGLFEFTVVFISIVVIFFIKPMPFEGRQFNPDGFKEMLAYVFYFLFFNFITFFTVEYCVGIIRAEYKKNYTKYFFMHDSNILKRVWFIQRKSLALTLEKIKNSITWLIMFIVMNEILFERAGSIGKSIIDSYSRSNGTLNLVYNITTLIFINIVMNLVIDCLIIFSSNKSVSGKDNIGNITKEHLKYENNNMFPKRKKSFIITVVGLSSIVFIFYIASILFNNKYYAIAGYYDFSEDSRRTVGNLFSFYKTNIRVNIDLPKGTLEKYGDTPLVKKSECGDYFTVIVLYVQNKCNTTTLLPYRDPETRRHFYIDGNINLGEKEFSPEDTIIDIGSQDVFKNMPFIEKTKSFRLQTGIGKNLFVNKPLFLIIPFYFCFFISLCLVTIIFTWLLYKLTIHFQIRKNGKIQVMASKSFNLVLVFFNSITLLVVLLIVNLFLQRHKVGFTQININSTFFDVLFNYVIVQVVVNFMFCLSYKNEIAQHINYIFSSNEFEYYDRIGMDTRRKKYIYKKKYGDNLLLKYISQNILFVFNINWFLSFAFNRWDEIGAKVFTDKIGLTYAISFENIFTKIISLRKDFVAIHDIVSLVILNVILFWGYCIFQRKFYNGNR
jgi:hypothetical protein